MKKTVSALAATAALALHLVLAGGSARATADPIIQSQQELNRLLRQQQLDQLECEHRISQLTYGLKINQIQQQLNQQHSPQPTRANGNTTFTSCKNN